MHLLKQYERPILIVILGALWGINFPVSKFALSYFDPYSFRAITSLLALIPYAALVAPLINRKFVVRRADMGSLLLIAIPLFVIVPLFNLISLVSIQSSQAIILIYTMPALSSLFYMVQSRDFNLFGFVPMLFCLAGCVLVIQGSGSFSLGHIIILTGATVWAYGGRMYDRTRITTDIRVGAFIQLAFASIFNIGLVVLLLSLGNPVQIPEVSAPVVLATIYVGIFGNGIAFIIWYFLMARFGSKYAAYSMMAAPPIGVLTSTFVNGEPLVFPVILGLTFMVISMFANHLSAQSR